MMSNEPPQGAQSADPVREAAQALIDATDTIVPEHLTANEAMDWCEIDNAKVDAAWDALRTALAAPEGPAPKPVTRKDGSMSFEEAQDLARKHAKAEPESYYSEPFEPHLWVINAVVEASAHWYQRAVDERVRRVKESNSRTPEAPPPVEARQPPQSELAKSLAWSNDDGWRAQRLATEFHEIYERLAPIFGYETRPDTKQFDPNSKNGKLMIAVCGNILAALAAPAGAIQRGHLGSTPWGETDDH